MINKINNLKDKQIIKYLFIISMIFNVLIGFLLSYNIDFSANYNLLFDSDSVRVISLLSTGWFNDSRSHVHPLYLLLSKPIINIISGITIDKMIAMIVFSSLTSAITIVLLYKTLSLFHKDNYFKVILSLCYLFTFGNMIFTASIETYNLSALVLVALWYYVIKKLQDGNFTKYSFFILAILGLLSLSITVTNFVVFLIAMFILFLSKKVKLKNLIAITLGSIIMLVSLSYCQHLLWNNTKGALDNNLFIEQTYVLKEKFPTRLNKIIRDDYYNSIIGSKQEMEVTDRLLYHTSSYQLRLKTNHVLNVILLTVFYVLSIIMIVRNYKSNLLINLGLTLTLLFNTGMHFIYGDNLFLYSLHFLYAIFLLVGMNYAKEKNGKLKKSLLIVMVIMLIVEIFNNSYRFIEVFKYSRRILPETFFLSALGFVKSTIFYLVIIASVLITILLFLIIRKKCLKEKNKDKKLFLGVLSIVALVCCELVFISLDSAKMSHQFLWKDIYPKNLDYPPASKIDFLHEDFKKHFQSEINSLQVYLDEYRNFKNTHEHTMRDDIIRSDYYYFGLGNRKKLVYTVDCLKDAKTGHILYQFDPKEYIIVPNEYAILMETVKGDFIKLYEDNEGVHYNKNGKDKIIDGTAVKIDLYDFKNEECSHIKKVLYGEILFNMKNNSLYNNVFVSKKKEVSGIDISKLHDPNDLKELLEKYSTDNTDEEDLLLNDQPYPLTWSEKERDCDYQKVSVISSRLASSKIAPTSSKKAIKLLLSIMEE